MPILTRSPGALFDPATAPDAAATLELDFQGAWARHEAALRGGPDGAPAWPGPGAALGGSTTELAAALVFGAVSSTGRTTGVADGCARVLTSSAPPEARTAAAGAHLVALAGPHYALLTPDARAAVARLAAALVGVRAPGAAAAASALIRHVRSGCATPENLALATCLAACLADAMDWLVGGGGGEGAGSGASGGGGNNTNNGHAPLAQAALLMVARLLPAVSGGGGGTGGGVPVVAAAAAASFRRAAAALATPLLTDHWALVAPGGRDLAAALGECAGVAEVARPLARLGAVVGSSPCSLSFTPGSPLARIARRRPPAALVASRVAPDAETRLHFLLSSVRLGNQGRYQAWFAARHLTPTAAAASAAAATSAASTTATTAAVVDAIRFIVAVYRPSGAVLASDVLPRWALLGWLVTVPRTPAGVAAAAAAVVADWATFDPASDSFMAAEPGALLMLQSLPRYAHVTVSILEALFAGGGGGEAAPSSATALAAGADALVARGVLRSFDRLASAPEIPAPLRARVRAVFGRHLTAGSGEGEEEERGGKEDEGEEAGRAAPSPPAPTPVAPAPAPAPSDSAAPGSASTATVEVATGCAAHAADEPSTGAKRRRAGTPAEAEEKEEEAPAAAKKKKGKEAAAKPPPAPPAAKVGSSDPGLDAALTALQEAVEEEEAGGRAAAAGAVVAALAAAGSGGKAAPAAATAPPAAKRRRGTTPASGGESTALTPPSPALVKEAADAVAALAGVCWCGDVPAPSPSSSLAAHAPPRTSLCGALLAACMGASPVTAPAGATLLAALVARPATCDARWRLLAVGAAAEEEGEAGGWGAAGATAGVAKKKPAKAGKGDDGVGGDGEDDDGDDPCVGPTAAAAFRTHHQASGGVAASARDAATLADLGAALATVGPAALSLSTPALLRGLSVDWGAAVASAAVAAATTTTSHSFNPATQPIRGVPASALRLLCTLAGAAGEAPVLAASADAAAGRSSAVVVGVTAASSSSTPDPAARYQDAAFAGAVVALASAAVAAAWPPPALRTLWCLVRAEALGHHRGRETGAKVAGAVLAAAAASGAGALAASPPTLAGLVPLLVALQPSAALVKAVLALPSAAAGAAEVALAAWAAPDAGGAAGARAAAAAALERAGGNVVGGGGGGTGKAGRKGGGGRFVPSHHDRTVRALWGVGD